MGNCIPIFNWIWQGYPGHFIASEACKFRLCTVVGKFLVSTIGDYYSRDGERRTVGLDRYYETMVFGAEKRQDCGCYEQDSGNELACVGYNEHEDAQRGHIKVCREWATKEKQDG